MSERVIVAFRVDDAAEWIAELACGHHQHVRHQPPLQFREWVLSDEGRRAHVGTLTVCRLCDQALLPERLTYARTTPVWDERTVPPALLRAHRVASTAWALLRVHQGKLRFHAELEPPLDLVLAATNTQAIPPGVAHEVRTSGPVRFSLDFFSIDPYLG